MAERELTFRMLSSATKEADDRGRGLTHSYLSSLVNGRDFASEHALELLGAALDVDPADWLEYRLAQARHLFDERQVGLELASANLAVLEALAGPVTDADPGGRVESPAEEFAQAIEAGAREHAPPPDEHAPRRRASASRPAAGSPSERSSS